MSPWPAQENMVSLFVTLSESEWCHETKQTIFCLTDGEEENEEQQVHNGS
jgi:hypothetical protein